MTTPSDIATLFSIFHDGEIEAWNQKGDQAEVIVNCTYLAPSLLPENGRFHIHLEGVQDLGFDAWGSPEEGFQPVHAQLNAVLNNPPFGNEISVAEAEQAWVHVTIHLLQQSGPVLGGVLRFGAAKARLSTSDGKEITLDQMEEVATRYWESL